MYEYRCKVLKVVDGDTVDVDIDLGFGIVLKDERVRLMGIEHQQNKRQSRKTIWFGAKKRLKELVGGNWSIPTQINKKGEDMKGKFGFYTVTLMFIIRD